MLTLLTAGAEQGSGTERGSLYHERQTQRCCGLHAVNNLLQAPPGSESHVSKADADALADSLEAKDKEEELQKEAEAAKSGLKARPCFPEIPTCRSTYRSSIPFLGGDYDIQVLVEALKTKGAEVVEEWALSSEKACESIGTYVQAATTASDSDDFLGLLLNRPARLGPGRHWYCLLHRSGRWIMLDSAESEPLEFSAGMSAVDCVQKHLKEEQQRMSWCPNCWCFGSTRVLFVFAVKKGMPVAAKTQSRFDPDEKQL